MANSMIRVVAVAGVLSVLPLSSLAADKDAGRAESMQQATEQMREQMYGEKMMTEQERMEYHERMRQLNTNEEREAYRSEHHELMKQRAKERGVELPDKPMPQGQGMGPGQGKGGGQGKGR